MQKTLKERIEKRKDRIFRPATSFLAKINIKPVHVTVASLAAAFAAFCLIVIQEYQYAALALVANVILDLLDGSLARYLKKDVGRGRFLDATIDNIAATAIIIALMIEGSLSQLSSTLFIYLMLWVNVIGVIKNNMEKKSKWHFSSSGGALVHAPKNIFFLFFLMWSFDITNILGGIIVLSNFYFVVLGVVCYIKIWKIGK